MPRFFIKSEQIYENQIKIIGEDVKHIKNVLRRKIGEEIEVCNQDEGIIYKCIINKIEENMITADIKKYIEKQESKIKVDIYQGLPKADKMELIVQKSVELGVNSIIPVSMKRCVVKIDARDENKKIERWQKISESAAKQCGRNSIPKIENICNIKDIINKKEEYNSIIIAFENENNYTLKQELVKIKNIKDKKLKIAVIIGPEGGFEEAEVEVLKENGGKTVTLGKRILRTETVALNILSIIMYELEN